MENLRQSRGSCFFRQPPRKMMLVMRISFILLFGVLFQVAATSLAQKVNIKSSETTYKNLFQEVERQTGIITILSNDEMDMNATIEVPAGTNELHELYRFICKDANMEFKLVDDYVVIKPSTVKIVTSNQELAQQEKVIKGVITDSNGAPLPGVNVFIEGTTTGTITSVDGAYELNVPSEDVNLVFSFIGFQMQTIAIDGRDVLNVTLTEDVQNLETVMVVAYGTAKKETFTGSAEVVGSEQLVNTTSTDISTALQGRVAGVQVSSFSGAAGSSAAIRIRGVGSANASAAPLYVVDGVPNAPIPAISDIETSTVLKDAAAAALYGSRAANGVIVITTKKGKGKAKINLSYKRTIGWKSSDNQDLMNADQYTSKVWEGLRNKAKYMSGPNDITGTPEQYAHDNLLNTMLYNPYYEMEDGKRIQSMQPFDDNGKLRSGVGRLYSTDWVDEAYRTSNIDDLHLSFGKGGDDYNMYGSLTFFNQEGIQVGNDYTRIDYNLNMNTTINKYVEIGINTNGRYQKYTPVRSMFRAYINAPTVPVYKRYGITGEEVVDGTQYGDFVLDKNGNKLYHWDTKSSSSESNLKAERETYIEETDNTNIIISPYLTIKPIDELTLSAKGSAKFFRQNENYFYNPVNGSGVSDKGRNVRESNNQRTLFGFLQATFEKKFGNHDIKAMAVYEAEEWIRRDLNATAKEFPMWQIAQNLDDGEVKDDMYSRQFENARVSALGQLEYGLLDKYYVSGSFRRDGSSRFGPNNRYGNFWSVGATWRLSEEQFMSSVDWINSLKLRGSYGVSGNDAIGNYAWQSTYTLDGKYNNTAGAELDQVENLNLGWEGNINSNIAVEFKMFNRFWGTVELYNRTSDRLLMWRQLPYTTGLTSRMENVGKISNKGIELMLGAQVIGRSDFSWETSVTLTSNKNNIEEWYGNNYNGQAYYDTGGSMFNYRMRKWAGVDPTTGSPLWYQKIEDDNGNWNGKTTVTNDWNKASEFDAKNDLDGADAEPTFYGSWVNDLTYKNFDFSMLFYFNVGSYAYNDMMGVLSNDGAQPGWNMHVDNINSWNTPGQQSEVPMYNVGDPTLAWWRSSRFLERADYLKLKNLVIGYTLPKRLTESIGLSNVRFYGMGENLFTWTKFKGYDPELNLDNQTTWSDIPPVTSVTLGVNVTF